MRFLNRSVNGWAGRLSRHRRGPVAGFLVLLLGLLMMGGLYATFSPAQAQDQPTDEELVQKGREIYTVNCSFCHGQNGEGVRTGGRARVGELRAAAEMRRCRARALDSLPRFEVRRHLTEVPHTHEGATQHVGVAAGAMIG